MPKYRREEKLDEIRNRRVTAPILLTPGAGNRQTDLEIEAARIQQQLEAGTLGDDVPDPAQEAEALYQATQPLVAPKGEPLKSATPEELKRKAAELIMQANQAEQGQVEKTLEIYRSIINKEFEKFSKEGKEQLPAALLVLSYSILVVGGVFSGIEKKFSAR